ncbi:hypothetical protein NECAME_06137 [Necator americanus]|uniref:Inhibitor of growth protein N-terminal histone-binding domain-containing protein n=1 Tax=Necator americanus TaxID=51031 RepID=W2TY74_NECAM|nr:hypothetical protein NECAME_06137 [Necator americanus]ETN85972.1 hypothetical protein NECAME_06137 [Necator americanus]
MGMDSAFSFRLFSVKLVIVTVGYALMSEKLKKYMEELDDLPPFIQKNAKEIRELDQETEKLMRVIQESTVSYVTNMKNTPMEQRVKWYKEMQAMYDEVDKLSEKKEQLADDMYNAVDTRIKEMDKMMVEFQELQIRNCNEAEEAEEGESSSNTLKRKGSRSARKGGKRKKGDDNKVTSAKRGNFKPSAIPAVDMPVDPNEPTYCSCHQVCKYLFRHSKCGTYNNNVGVC